MNRTRVALTGMFLTFLVLQVSGVMFLRRRMWPDEFQSLILKLLAVYSVHFGVILGGSFAQTRVGARKAPSGLGWTVLLFAAVWNILLGWRVLAFCLARQDSATELVAYLDSVSSASSFLVAGGLAYFFGAGGGVSQKSGA